MSKAMTAAKGGNGNGNGKKLTVVGPSAGLMAKMALHAGKGVSTAQEDNIVPLISLLQALSPQVNKRANEYIEGAEAGAIWLRNAPNPIVDGEVGFQFQPCAFERCVNEWIPRESGGGFVARHPVMPGDVRRVEDPKNPARSKFVRPSGNECIDTRYHAGFVLTDHGALPYVIPFTSSGHTVSKQWMSLMGSHVLPNGQPYPSFARSYRIKTRQRTNAAGTWFVLDISDDDFVDDAQFEKGAQLNSAFAAGAKRADAPEAEAVADDDVI